MSGGLLILIPSVQFVAEYTRPLLVHLFLDERHFRFEVFAFLTHVHVKLPRKVHYSIACLCGKLVVLRLNSCCC